MPLFDRDRGQDVELDPAGWEISTLKQSLHSCTDSELVIGRVPLVIHPGDGSTPFLANALHRLRAKGSYSVLFFLKDPILGIVAVRNGVVDGSRPAGELSYFFRPLLRIRLTCPVAPSVLPSLRPLPYRVEIRVL